MPAPTAPSAPTAEQIQQASRILAGLVTHLREEPPLPGVVPLLAPLLDENTGVPMLLGDVLRAAARIVSRQAAVPWTDETRDIVSTLREAAQEITDWHILHGDIQRLSNQSPQAPSTLTAQ
ncbi:hypothetical protein [Streptomyces sp. NPDC059943]|uniref:hypothetical protein n=1 Tax=Streptomyces sp. NPDC059943 TaxID=3347010 RepID=UPI00364FA09C